MKDPNETKFLSEEDGGAVAEVIKKYKYCVFSCTCKTRIDNPNFEGYTHSGGFADSTGSRWWMYIICPGCKYAWAINKLDRQIMKYDDAETGESESGVSKYELFYAEVCLIQEQRLLAGMLKIAGSPCIVYSIPHKGRKVTITPVLAESGKSPLDYVQAILDRLKPMCYVVVAEAYMGRKGTKAKDIDTDPGKQEMLVCTGRSFDGTFNVTKMWKVIRNKDLEVTAVEQVADSNTVYTNKLP